MDFFKVSVGYYPMHNITITSREIREAVIDITQNSEYESVINWHTKKPPFVIFSKPYSKCTNIYTFKKDIADFLKTKLLERRVLYVPAGNNFHKKVFIKNVSIDKLDYEPVKDGNLYLYSTRMPIITAVHENEIKVNTVVKKIGAISDVETTILENIISRTLKYTIKHHFNRDIELNDLKIKAIESRQVEYWYKEGVQLPGWLGTFFSNYKLPTFVGYKIGLGFGEIFLRQVLPLEKFTKFAV
jgi:hypothetical protein